MSREQGHVWPKQVTQPYRGPEVPRLPALQPCPTDKQAREVSGHTGIQWPGGEPRATWASTGATYTPAPGTTVPRRRCCLEQAGLPMCSTPESVCMSVCVLVPSLLPAAAWGGRACALGVRSVGSL